jgi:thiol-disulfide isomerase/thioredoxin
MRNLLLAALLLGGPAAATELEDAQDNFETVLRTYVGTKSSGDYWILKKSGAKPMRLKLKSLERPTVRRAPGGRWRGLADFEEASSKKVYFADVTVDTASDLWDVKSLHWLTLEEAGRSRADAAKTGAATAERKPGPGGLLPEMSLASLDGHETFLPECGKPKCLTVVVAPWCPHCRAVADVLLALQDWLPAHDVGMRMVVSHDSEENVRNYAKAYGPSTLTDPEANFSVGGVPAFIVSTNGGAILSKQSGAWEDVKDPAVFAQRLGLP